MTENKNKKMYDSIEKTAEPLSLQFTQDEALKGSSSLLDWVQLEKAKDRVELASLPGGIAQLRAESILDPKIGRVIDERQLRWTGDLADPWDEPYE